MHCRFWSRRWSGTNYADLTIVCTESFGETRCNGHTGERGKCTSYSSRKKKGLRSHSSEGQKALEKPIALFHQSREIWSGVLCSETLIRRIWEDLFLKATRITCSIRQDQTWRSKNFMSSPSMSASVNYNDKQKSKDWRYRTHKTYFLNLDENKFDYKKNCRWKKKFSEIPESEICTKCEKWKGLKKNEYSAKNKSKSRDNSAAHFPMAANAKTEEFFEWFLRFSRCGI